MPYSAVATYAGQSVDASAPGAPSFVSVVQDARTWNIEVQLPTQDADGSELTGLTELVVVSVPMTGGEDPFAGMKIEECMALANANSQSIKLTQGDAGAVKSVQTPVVNMGGWQAFAIAVGDNPA